MSSFVGPEPAGWELVEGGPGADLCGPAWSLGVEADADECRVDATGGRVSAGGGGDCAGVGEG